MTAEELKLYRKAKSLTQAALADWLKTTKRSVVAWETGQNPVPAWVEDKVNSERMSLNPTNSYEVFRSAQQLADSLGLSMDQWVASLIEAEIARHGQNPAPTPGEAASKAAAKASSTPRPKAKPAP